MRACSQGVITRVPVAALYNSLSFASVGLSYLPTFPSHPPHTCSTRDFSAQVIHRGYHNHQLSISNSHIRRPSDSSRRLLCNMSSTMNQPPTNSVSNQTNTNYAFPTYRLKQRQSHPDRTPLVLVACGSFSPITILHLRMFEMGKDFAKFSTDFEVVGGYLSPVSDSYKKAGLASAHHRLRMCELAVDQTSNWLMVDPWEAVQSQYIPTAQVLDHFDHEINTVMGGIEVEPGVRRKVRIILLAGADLIQTMSTPGVWSEKVCPSVYASTLHFVTCI